jgi:hypothetical protein
MGEDTGDWHIFLACGRGLSKSESESDSKNSRLLGLLKVVFLVLQRLHCVGVQQEELATYLVQDPLACLIARMASSDKPNLFLKHTGKHTHIHIHTNLRNILKRFGLLRGLLFCGGWFWFCNTQVS